MKARRYQLRKDAAAIVARGEPWLFRDHMSSAADVFDDGQWLRLVDGANRVVGHGIYEREGAIAIRILRTGPEPVDAAWLRPKLVTAVAARADLAATTDGIRLLHGESDGVPAVTADRFADTLVVASYAAGADAIARYAARALAVPNVVLRPARRRRGPAQPARVLRGAPGDIVTFSEDGERFAVDLAAGHKTGTYLDLRGLRRHVRALPLAGARVLNLFAYTGMLGRAAELAGATRMTQVDASERALAFAAAHHVGDPAHHRFVTADVFEWLPALAADEQFELVIVDPPAMTSRKAQVPAVLAAYRKLYRAAARHVAPGGLLVSACCTSRVERDVFRRTVRESLPPALTLERELAPEIDHPVAFAQADYLKILCWRAVHATGAA